jgi:hypothetical protein
MLVKPEIEVHNFTDMQCNADVLLALTCFRAQRLEVQVLRGLKFATVQVLFNPFDDMVPREKEKTVDKESVNKKEKKSKGTKYAFFPYDFLIY